MKKMMFAMATAAMVLSMGCDGVWNTIHKVVFHVTDGIQTVGALDQLGII